SGCTLSKKSTDKSVTKYVLQNTGLVKEAAEFAVKVTYEQSNKGFNAKDVQDPTMKRKIESLGSSVYVNYEGGAQYEIPDSSVTFETITLAGVTEIVYDFATKPREFSNNTRNRREYYFVRLTDRIYYRRRPIPMM